MLFKCWPQVWDEACRGGRGPAAHLKHLNLVSEGLLSAVQVSASGVG